MPHADVLFDKLKKINVNPMKLQYTIDNFEKIVINVRNNLLAVTEDVQDVQGVKGANEMRKN